MENAVEALKMVFAVMVLVMALSVSIISFNKVKATSDIVLYTQDETNYYDYQGAVGKAAENRIVGLETIIPTLYKYYKENYTVMFRQCSNYNEETGEFSGLSYLPIYETQTNYKLRGYYYWGEEEKDKNQSTYDTLMHNKYSSYLPPNGYTELGNKKIFSFDLEEETLRREPWTGSDDKSLENLNCFLSGGTYINPSGSTKNNYNYNSDFRGGFSNKYKNDKFVETIGEYTYKSSDSTEEGSLVREKKKRIIIFTLIK